MSVCDCNGRPIKIGMKLKRVIGRHGILDLGDICIVRAFGKHNSNSIHIELDYTYTYDSKYFEIIDRPAKSYLPDWL